VTSAPAPDPHRLLCDTATLAAWTAQPDRPLVVVDVGFDLVDTTAGERAYGQSRLPGAFYAHLDRDLSAPKAAGRDPRGRHPLPARDAFARTVGAWGIGPATQVLVYDRQGGMFAGRLWWLLQWIGHDRVAVLDGGLPAWQAEGRPIEVGSPTPRRVEALPYPVAASTVPVVDAEQLRRGLGRVRVVDARAPERFRGEVEPLDPVAGHIPGAMNRFFQHNLQPDGRFKAPEVLRRELATLLHTDEGAAVVHHCGSGVTACHNLIAQAVAGLGQGALYPGSWSEWCADPDRPVARG
jgi:thiosulfate/3-mercaptopyruvate sulfurtransferase